MSSSDGSHDVDLLEPAFERRVLLDVLAVLVERRRTDEAQRAAREQRLDHVAGVDRAFGATRADERVQLVDERDDLAVGCVDLLEHGLEPLLELTAVLRARDHRTEVERDEPLAAQTFGHVALDDAPRETFDDRGLADAGIADEHGVVLRAPREHLDHAPDLFVAADHRVDVALARLLGEVAPVLLERLVLLFGVVARDAMTRRDLQRVEHGVVRDAGSAEEIADTAGHLGHREQEVLGRQVLVVERGPLASAASSTRYASAASDASRTVEPLTRGRGAAASRRAAGNGLAGTIPMRSSTPVTMPSGVATSARKRCSVETSVWPGSRASLGGAERLGGLAGETVGVDGHRPQCLWSRSSDRARAYAAGRGAGWAADDDRSRRCSRCVCFHGVGHGCDTRARRRRPLELGDAAPRLGELVLELEDPLDSREPDAGLRQLLDVLQQRDVALRVAAAPALRALRLDETLALVDAQRLRVHARELRGDRDDVEGATVRFHRCSLLRCRPPAVLLRLMRADQARADRR